MLAKRRGWSLVLLVCTSLSWGAEPQTIFDARSHCQPNFLANFWKCQDVSAKVATNPPSRSEDQGVKNLSFENQLSLALTCTSTQPVAVTYRMGRLNAKLGQTNDFQIQTLVTPVAYDGDQYELTVSNPADSILVDGCRLEVVSNVTVPNLASVKARAGVLSSGLSEQIELSKRLDLAATLPANWVVAREINQRFRDELVQKTAVQSQLSEELTQLKSIASSQLSAAQQLRMNELEKNFGLLDTIRLEIDNLALLVDQLGDAFPDNDLCLSGAAPDPVFCLSKVTEAKGAVDKLLNQKIESAMALITFLDDEVVRLAASATELDTQVQQILAQLRVSVGEPQP